MRRIHRLGLALALLLAAVPARAEFNVSFNGGPTYTSPTNTVRVDSSYSIYSSNSSSGFDGYGVAGPGFVSAGCRIQTIWDGVFSGGAGHNVNASAYGPDSYVSGPGGSVTGTLHYRLHATFDRTGGFADNNAHEGSLAVYIDARFTGAQGQYEDGNHSSFGSYVLTGVTGPTIDVPIDVTADFLTNYGFTMGMRLTAAAYTYGNVNTNDGLIDAKMTLRLEEQNGQVMSLPAGYSFQSPTFHVVDNHYAGVAAVEPAASRTSLALALAGPNPTAGPTRLTFSTPRAGIGRIAIYDVGGRQVRRLAAGRFEAGERSLEWDGRDGAGTPVAAGLYFARAEFGGRACVQRIARSR